MNRSRAWFDAVAAETGYRRDTLEKVIRLGELGAELTRHQLLGTVLVLKGGTALNLCFGAPPRLSVDLDFNYIGAEDRAAMLEQRPLVERAIGAVARAQGYRLQWSRAEHAGRKRISATAQRPALPTASNWTSTSCTVFRSISRLRLSFGSQVTRTDLTSGSWALRIW
jgi:hypothetical protein